MGGVGRPFPVCGGEELERSALLPVQEYGVG